MERPSRGARPFPVRPGRQAAGGRQFHGQFVRQHRRPLRHRLAARPLHRAVRREARPRALAVLERFLQALQRRRLPERLPHGRHRPDRPGQRVRPAGRLHRMQVLHSVLPLRRDRAPRGNGHRAQVHVVQRPDTQRPGNRLRQGLPDRIDPVRGGPGAQGPGRRAPCPAQGAGIRRGQHLRLQGGGRPQRVLPVPGPAPGVRPAGGAGRAPAAPRGFVRCDRGRCVGAWSGGAGQLPGEGQTPEEGEEEKK